MICFNNERNFHSNSLNTRWVLPMDISIHHYQMMVHKTHDKVDTSHCSKIDFQSSKYQSTICWVKYLPITNTFNQFYWTQTIYHGMVLLHLSLGTVALLYLASSQHLIAITLSAISDQRSHHLSHGKMRWNDCILRGQNGQMQIGCRGNTWCTTLTFFGMTTLFHFIQIENNIYWYEHKQ